MTSSVPAHPRRQVGAARGQLLRRREVALVDHPELALTQGDQRAACESRPSSRHLQRTAMDAERLIFAEGVQQTVETPGADERIGGGKPLRSVSAAAGGDDDSAGVAHAAPQGSRLSGRQATASRK